MTTFEEKVTEQNAVGEEIQKLVRNYKKDPLERKSREYFVKRLQQLEELSEHFESNDDVLRGMKDPPLSHPYFKDDYHKQIAEVIEQYLTEFSKKLAEQPQAQTSKSVAIQTPGAIRKLNALLHAVNRQCVTILDDTTEYPPQTYEVKTNNLLQNWQQLQDMNLDMWEQYEDPAAIGFHEDDYLEVEGRVQEVLAQLSMKTIPTNRPVAPDRTSINKQVQMPKISIPTFSGDYSEWQQFHDLFVDMIDSQSISKSQKMWYLVTSLAGQPKNLIKHLSITCENYDIAWQLITNRYNNKRAIVKTIIKTMIDQKSLGSRASAAEIRKLHDDINEGMLTLKSIKVEGTCLVSAVLTYLILPKLDKYTRDLYEQSLANTRDIPDITELLQFLNSRFESLESMEPTEVTRMPTHKSLTVNQNATCKICQGNYHPIYKCDVFIRKSIPERSNIVQTMKLCFNCLRSGHQVSQCSSRKCSKCNKRHNTLLHREEATQTKAKPSGPVSTEKVSLFSTSGQRPSYVLLGTAAIKITAANGEQLKCRAILDSGSQVNLISQRLVTKLQLNTKPLNIIIEGIGKGKKGINSSISTEIHSHTGNYKANFNAFVIQHIVSKQPQEKISTLNWKLPQNITLADPEFHQPGDIDILLGAEYYHELLLDGYVKLSNNLPSLQNTVFGWICVGKIDDQLQNKATCGVCTNDDNELNTMLSKFWQLDEVSSNKQLLTEAERKCEEHFTQHTTRNSDGRFVVQLPFVENPSCLGNSLQQATNRFLSLERRLEKQPQIREQYIQFMREYEELGHMTKIREHEI